MKNNWQKIWDRKGGGKDENNTLRTLLDVDGFDRGAGKVKVGNWEKYTEYVSKKLGAGEDDSMYEVGCGAGAFLYQFYKRGHKVGGMDYSSSLIGVAREVMRGNFETGEAIKIDTKNKYDFILANSVFHYFSHMNYAEHVLTKMLKKANKAVAILDVPDKSLKDKAEKTRRKNLLKGEYEKKYKNLKHLYYNRGWFYELGEKYGYKVKIFNQNIGDYRSNSFRFNVFISKGN